MRPNELETVKIAGILEDFSPYEQEDGNLEGYKLSMKVLFSKEGFKQILEKNSETYVNVYVSTNKVNALDDKINNLHKENVQIAGTNLYQTKMTEKSNNSIIKMALYTFAALISIFSIINILNTIISSTALRKRDFAMLQSIGMSEKQIRKMLSLEGIFYGIKGIAYGITISLVILYLIYIVLMENKLYIFTYPWKTAIGITAITFVIINIAMMFSKKKIKNIIDEIRKENT